MTTSLSNDNRFSFSNHSDGIFGFGKTEQPASAPGYGTHKRWLHVIFGEHILVMSTPQYVRLALTLPYPVYFFGAGPSHFNNSLTK